MNTLVALIGSAIVTGLTYLLGVAVLGAPALEGVGWIEVTGVILNYACVYLTVRQNINCWPIGIIAVIFLGVLFWQLNLMASLALSILYFLPIQFYGWYKWYQGLGVGFYDNLPVTRLNKEGWMKLLFVAGFAYVAVTTVGVYFQTAFAGYDSAILVISIAAQYLLSFKKIESWILWMAVNVLSIYVYGGSGAVILAAQYSIFLLNAFYGFYSWRKVLQ